MTAEGAIFFVLIIGGIVAAIGFVAELLVCRANDKRAKFIIPAGGALLYVLCGAATQDFSGGAAALFGIITIGAVIMLLIDYLWNNRKAK